MTWRKSWQEWIWVRTHIAEANIRHDRAQRPLPLITARTPGQVSCSATEPRGREYEASSRSCDRGGRLGINTERTTLVGSPRSGRHQRDVVCRPARPDLRRNGRSTTRSRTQAGLQRNSYMVRSAITKLIAVSHICMSSFHPASRPYLRFTPRSTPQTRSSRI
jgi:hypothetical protein